MSSARRGPRRRRAVLAAGLATALLTLTLAACATSVAGSAAIEAGASIPNTSTPETSNTDTSTSDTSTPETSSTDDTRTSDEFTDTGSTGTDSTTTDSTDTADTDATTDTATTDSTTHPAGTAETAGECLFAQGSGSSVHGTVLPCTDPTATYVITARGDSGAAGCDEHEVTYNVSKGTLSVDYCLYYNVQMGDCLTIAADSDGADTKVACASAVGDPNTEKVLLADASSSDETACPAATDWPLPNTTRNMLICLGPNS